MSDSSAHEADWPEPGVLAGGAEMSRRMCEDGDHYEVAGRCTACGATFANGDDGAIDD